MKLPTPARHRRIKAWLAALALLGLAAGLAFLPSRRTTFSFRCGILPTANAPYLDGTGDLLQHISWHRGNGRRTWGDTCGIKLARCYVTLEITRINPEVSRAEANEEPEDGTSRNHGRP